MDSLLEIIDGIIRGPSHTKNVNSAGPRASHTHRAVALAAEGSPGGESGAAGQAGAAKAQQQAPRLPWLSSAFPRRGSEPYLDVPASVTIFLGEVSFPHLPPPAV